MTGTTGVAGGGGATDAVIVGRLPGGAAGNDWARLGAFVRGGGGTLADLTRADIGGGTLSGLPRRGGARLAGLPRSSGGRPPGAPAASGASPPAARGGVAGAPPNSGGGLGRRARRGAGRTAEQRRWLGRRPRWRGGRTAEQGRRLGWRARRGRGGRSAEQRRARRRCERTGRAGELAAEAIGGRGRGELRWRWREQGRRERLGHRLVLERLRRCERRRRERGCDRLPRRLEGQTRLWPQREHSASHRDHGADPEHLHPVA